MSIAGVDFAVTSGQAIRLRIDNPLYRSFCSRICQGKKSQNIRVNLSAGRLPALERLEKIFDTNESWALFRDKKYRWVSYQPPSHPRPFWIARFDHEVKRVTIFYGPQDAPVRKKRMELRHPICYPLDQLLLMYFLARRKGILTHAAGVVKKGRAFLFAGASGAGKSTFSQLLAGARVGKLLSDERMIVREIDGTMQAFGTPWAGTAGIARKGQAPLAGIFILQHGTDNHIEKIGARDALDNLLPMFSIPWYDPDTMPAIIAFAKRLVAKVPAYVMRFRPEPSAADFFQRFIENQS